VNTALQLQVQARRDALAPTQQQLTGFLVAHGIGGRTLYACELVLEEILTNIQNHAYDDAAGHVIDLRVTLESRGVTLDFVDDGRPFDPLQQPEPAPAGSIETASAGGRGLMLVRRHAQSVEHERRDGRNHLRVKVSRAGGGMDPPA
jgi:anti-sigma regulatory factor (Ser/Thr protein kinase)